jgi:hypothetical protein
MFDLFFGGTLLTMLIVTILGFVLWIWMLVDCVQRKFINDTEKLIWIIAMIIFPVVASLVYLFAVRYGSSQGVMKNPKL